MRLFVALLLEPGLLDSLASFQRRQQKADTSGSVRWVHPEGIHLTLKFLGEVPSSRLPEIVRALDSALRERQAPVLGLGSTGAFPNAKHPRVLWVGIDDTGTALGEIVGAVEEAMAGLGWEREGRAFQAHLTLGRVRETAPPGASGGPGPAFVATRLPPVEAQRHQRVALMQSHLGPGGARYESLHVWELGSAPFA